MHPWQRAVAVLGAVIVLALNVAATIQLFERHSTFGYVLTYTDGYRVASVYPGTAAANAGIVPGDRFNFTKSNIRDRIIALSYEPALPGEAATFQVVHDGHSRPVTLRAHPLGRAALLRAEVSPGLALTRIAGFAYIVIGLAIVLRRPGRLTWGLFFYLLSASDVTLHRLPLQFFFVAQFIYDVLAVAGPVGLVVFAARFPDDRVVGWRAWLDRLAIPIAMLFAIPNIAWDATALFYGWSPARWMSLGSTLGALVLIATAAATLATAYANAPPKERKRLQWIIAGVLMSLWSYSSEWAAYWSAAYPFVTADGFVWVSAILYALAPFPIAYAVLRHRVFDISFVISRTAVYAILTAAIFAVFSFIEWLMGRLLQSTGTTVALEVAAAIAIGFWLNTIHSRLDRVIDWFLFRRRHMAEKQLTRIASALLSVDSAATIEEALVHEPVIALDLTHASLFRRNEHGQYLQVDARTNLAQPNPPGLDEHILLQIQGDRAPLRLHDVIGADSSVDTASLPPVLAVPIFVRSRLEAVTLYGAHVDGEDIDPGEVALLANISSAAGIAYNNLDSRRATREAEKWRRIAERKTRELLKLRELRQESHHADGAGDY